MFAFLESDVLNTNDVIILLVFFYILRLIVYWSTPGFLKLSVRAAHFGICFAAHYAELEYRTKIYHESTPKLSAFHGGC